MTQTTEVLPERPMAAAPAGGSLRDMRGKRVLVTGGAQGMGFEIAKRFAREGAVLLLTDVQEERLQASADELRALGTEVHAYPLNVTDGAAVRRVAETVERETGGIHILINNAGIVAGGPFLEVPIEKHLATYQVNIEGLVAVTHAFLPQLLRQPQAALVNLASASGFVGLPFGSTYASSKWAVIGFSDSLRAELRELGHRHVSVTSVCPGYVDTGMFTGVKSPLFMPFLRPEKVAEAVFRAVRRRKAQVLMPWLVRMTPLLKGLLPRRLFERIGRRLGVTTSMTTWKGHGPAK